MRKRREQIVAPWRSQLRRRETAPRLVRVRRSNPLLERAGSPRYSFMGVARIGVGCCTLVRVALMYRAARPCALSNRLRAPQ